MSKETVDVIVDGGKASAGPAMGQAFGPLGVDMQAILAEINKKTEGMQGMKVPVKVTVDTDTKEFDLEVGTPPVSELIKKELNLDKGSGYPHLDKKGNLSIEQVIKIANVKKESLLVNNLKSAVKTVAGSCVPLGVLVEGKGPKEACKEIDEGKFDNEINSEATETSEEKKKVLSDQLKTVQAQLEAERTRVMKAAEEKKEEEAKEEGEKAEEKPEEKKDTKAPAKKK